MGARSVLLLSVFVLGSNPSPPVRNPHRVSIVDHVRAVCGSNDAGHALLIVHVFEPGDGHMVPGSKVRLAWTERPGVVEATTDSSGGARFALDSDGSAQVLAELPAFSISVAEKVEIRRGCVSAVSLPLQVEPLKDIVE
jgi:hypothetical protein